MKGYFKFIVVFVFILAFLNKSYSTHVRAGEITFKQIDKLTYEIKLITYTNTGGLVDRPEVDIFFGDNTKETVSRDAKILLGNNIQYNRYVTRHTYSGDGTYIIRHFDHNRMAGIRNMDNSVWTPFYCETQLIISPTLGSNRSPILLRPPMDFAEVGEIYVHNPNAYDPDGDSLAFSLITPKQNVGIDVNGYYIPDGGIGFSLDQYNGELVWNVPDTIGIYNIAILVEEFRWGYRIGYVVRDMQIIVDKKNNRPPVIDPIADTCILAGSNLSLIFDINANDIDYNQIITLTATGGPFTLIKNKAIINPDPAKNVASVSTRFVWEPACDHIRKRPYRVVFKASDSHPLNPLADYEHVFIQVIGPAPENLAINSTINGIELDWDLPSSCKPVGYYIYRRMDSSFWDTSTCEIGIPGYTGFVFLDSVRGTDKISYFDDNKGQGLSPGIEYCYRVTALYWNVDEHFEPVEGYASNEVCAMQEKELPIITHVSVLETDDINGKIFLAWANPIDLDTQAFPGPYSYNILRKIDGENYQLVKKITANQLYEISDTSLIDTLLDSENKQYLYQIEFYFTNSSGIYELLGKSQIASSVFLNIVSTHKSLNLSWDVDVPWENDTFIIYRKNDATGNFDSIAYSFENTYTDLGLENGKTYCYLLKSIGGYSVSANLTHPIINYSQENCAFPRDTIPPCPPILYAESFCDDPPHSELNWEYPGDTTCAWDVIGYRIYYSKLKENNFQLIDEVDNYTTWLYSDERRVLQYNMAGCYFITAVDSYDNESIFSNQVCVDNCPVYELPNVFTPNGDFINDTFVPMDGYKYVGEVNMRIYNRWGQLVYQTIDPRINWDGKDFETQEDCTESTYYYICIIYELYLEGNKPRTIRGTLTLIR